MTGYSYLALAKVSQKHAAYYRSNFLEEKVIVQVWRSPFYLLSKSFLPLNHNRYGIFVALVYPFLSLIAASYSHGAMSQIMYVSSNKSAWWLNISICYSMVNDNYTLF